MNKYITYCPQKSTPTEVDIAVKPYLFFFFKMGLNTYIKKTFHFAVLPKRYIQVFEIRNSITLMVGNFVHSLHSIANASV